MIEYLPAICTNTTGGQAWKQASPMSALGLLLWLTIKMNVINNMYVKQSWNKYLSIYLTPSSNIITTSSCKRVCQPCCSTESLVHCFNYISLLLGWWNIVQNGDPLYAAVDYMWRCGGHIWPNRVQFFAKNTWPISQVGTKKFWAQKKSFWGRRRGIFETVCHFTEIEDFYKNWGFCM